MVAERRFDVNEIPAIVAGFNIGLPMNRNDVKKKCSLRAVRANGSLREGAPPKAVEEPSGGKRSIKDIYGTALMRRTTLYHSFHRVLLPSFCFAKIHLPPGGRRRNVPNPFTGSK